MSEYIRAYVKKQHFKVHWSEVKFKTQFGVCIYQALRKRGYNQTTFDDWNLYWSEKQFIDSVFEGSRIQPHQKINHFRTYYELCRKDNLSRNLKRHKRTLEREGKQAEAAEYNFMPVTYHLPLEYGLFLEEFKKLGNDSKNIWIMKPTAKSQGKGIFLFNKLSAITNWAENPQAQPYILQKYINDPLLIGGKKFDLRLYVLCTSYHPLTVYLNRSGFARFTHYRYDDSKLYQAQIHLTNVAIQKTTQEYNPQLGGKWLVDKLKMYLLSKYDPKKVNECFCAIQNLIINTLKSVIKLMANDKRCFELYGFDIMFDASLKPWIIQVNGSPSMRANTPSDCVLKCGIIDDVMTIIDMERMQLPLFNICITNFINDCSFRLKGDEDQVGGFDIIYRNDTKINVYPNFSFLGCLNNRLDNIKKLARTVQNRLAKEAEEEQMKKNKSMENNRVNNAQNNNTSTAKRGQSISKTSRPPNMTSNNPGSFQVSKYNGMAPQQVAKIPNVASAARKNTETASQVSTRDESKQFSSIPNSGNSLGSTEVNLTSAHSNKNWVIRKNHSFKKDSTHNASNINNAVRVSYGDGTPQTNSQKNL